LAAYRSAMPIPLLISPALIATRIFTAMSGPLSRAMAETPISDVTSIFSAGVLSGRTVKPEPSNQLGKEKSKTTHTLREVPLGLSQ
jgi:hypothetical protein